MPPSVLRPPTDAETERLDALPRMSHAARRRTVADTAAEPGSYLVAEDGGEQRLLRLGAGTTPIRRGFGSRPRLDAPAGPPPPPVHLCERAGAGVPRRP